MVHDDELLLMDHDELDRWCFLFASTAARQDIKIAVLRKVIEKLDVLDQKDLQEVEERAMEQSFRARRSRYQRMLKAFWLEQSPERLCAPGWRACVPNNQVRPRLLNRRQLIQSMGKGVPLNFPASIVSIRSHTRGYLI